MPPKVHCLPVVSLAVLLPGIALAQLGPRTERPPDGGNRQVLVSIFIPSLPHAAFTATVNAAAVRQLADGSNIRVKNHRLIARDEAGRIFQERRMLVPDDGQRESIVTQTEISDPVAHKLYICVPREHTCQLESFTAPDFAPPPSGNGRAGGPQREDLGRQTVSGLEVTGTQETDVIPSGAIGNDNPLQVKREYWYSAQLGVNLISKREDPRFGTQDFEVSDIALGEPDAKLFDLPKGWRVIDMRGEAERAAARSAEGSPVR